VSPATATPDKKQMQLMVRALLKMGGNAEPSDAADALAVALCHIQGEQFARRFGLAAAPPPPRPHKESWQLQRPAGNPPREFPVSSQPDERFFLAASVLSFMRRAFSRRCACKPVGNWFTYRRVFQIQRSGIHRNSHPGKLHCRHL